MTNRDDIEAIRLRFLDAWADATPVIIPNVTDSDDEPDTAYVVLSVMPTMEDRLTIGPTPDYEVRGLIWIDVYSPIADCDAVAWSLADRVATIFRDWQSPDHRIRCDKVSFRNGEDAGEHMRIIVNVTYRSRH